MSLTSWSSDESELAQSSFCDLKRRWAQRFEKDVSKFGNGNRGGQ